MKKDNCPKTTICIEEEEQSDPINLDENKQKKQLLNQTSQFDLTT